MQPHEALDVAAQVAVTLAGFAGIVVVFRPQALHQWSPIDRFRLRLLLGNSTLPLGYALLGIFLLSMDPPPPRIWSWCSGVAFLAQLVFTITITSKDRRLSLAGSPSTNKPLFYTIGALGAIATMLQLVNVVWLNLFWPFFAAIFVFLVAAIVQFTRLILIAPEDKRGH